MKVAIRKTAIKYHTFQEDEQDKTIARRTDSELIIYGGGVTEGGCMRTVAMIPGAIYDGYQTVTECYEIGEEIIVAKGVKLEKVEASNTEE